MTQVHWILDTLLLERNSHPGVLSLSDAIRQAGHTVTEVKYVPVDRRIEPEPVFDFRGCNIAYGSIQFCKLMESRYGQSLGTPGLYFNANVKHFAKYAPYLGQNLLNRGYYLLPFGDVLSRQLTGVFLKPESGLKEFVGQVVTCEADYDKLSLTGSIDPSTLCVVAPAQDIKAEFRYVIANGKVITGSEYRWDNVLDVRTDTHPLCDAKAQEIAEAEWQADSVYVCDVALVHNPLTGPGPYEEARVVELNAFSSSGLYACDTALIAQAVSEAALREFAGED